MDLCKLCNYIFDCKYTNIRNTCIILYVKDISL